MGRKEDYLRERGRCVAGGRGHSRGDRGLLCRCTAGVGDTLRQLGLSTTSDGKFAGNLCGVCVGLRVDGYCSISDRVDVCEQVRRLDGIFSSSGESEVVGLRHCMIC